MNFEDNLKNLANFGSWGIHVELQDTSDLFNMAVFVSFPNPFHIKQYLHRHASHCMIKLTFDIMTTLSFTSNHQGLTVLTNSKQKN